MKENFNLTMNTFGTGYGEYYTILIYVIYFEQTF